MPMLPLLLWHFQSEVDLNDFLMGLDDDWIYLARYGRQRIEDMKREPRRCLRRYIEALNRFLKKENPEPDIE